MRFVVALLSFALLSGAAAQQSDRYMGTDARVGVHPRWGWPIFPGVNFVQGHQRFFSEQGFWAAQVFDQVRSGCSRKDLAAKRLLTFLLLAT